MLYQKLNVENLKELQDEVIEFFDNNQHLLQPESVDEYFVQMKLENLPKISEFLNSRRLTQIVETSTCFIPGHQKLRIHIDGLRKESELVPVGKLKANQNVLVIPIQNYMDTVNYWYNNEDVSDEDEIIKRRIRPEPPYDFYISFSKKQLEPIGSTTIDKPTFIKSDIYHNVHNNGPETRLVFIVRFYEKLNDTIDNLFMYKDLV